MGLWKLKVSFAIFSWISSETVLLSWNMLEFCQTPHLGEQFARNSLDSWPSSRSACWPWQGREEVLVAAMPIFKAGAPNCDLRPEGTKKCRCHEVIFNNWWMSIARPCSLASKHSGGSELCDLWTETSFKNKAATCEWSQLEVPTLALKMINTSSIKTVLICLNMVCSHINPGLCSHAQMAAHVWQGLLKLFAKHFNSLTVFKRRLKNK